jgi:hypothetical protein
MVRFSTPQPRIDSGPAHLAANPTSTLIVKIDCGAAVSGSRLLADDRADANVES